MTDTGPSLTESIGSEHLVDLFSTIGDTALDAAIASGALDSVPIFGLLTGIYRAQRDVRAQLFLRKVAKFLSELKDISIDKRLEFAERLKGEGKLNDFGETVLLILDRIDDTRKPSMMGRIMAAHIRGHIEYTKAMRLISIVNRCYSEDLEYLASFQPGFQGDSQDVAESLASMGLLTITGEDLGGWGDETPGSRTSYALNSYGQLFVTYALG